MGITTSKSTTIDLAAMAVTAMENIVASGDIEKKLEEALKKAIDGIIADNLSWSSSFYKLLKEEMTRKMAVDFSRLDLPLYNEYLLSHLQEIIAGQLETAGLAGMQGQLEKIMKREIRSKYTLLDLVEIFKSCNVDCKDEDDEITLFIEKGSYGARFIYIDENSETPRYDCGYRFAISDRDNGIFGLDFGRSKSPTANILDADSFASLLLRIKAAGAEVIVEDEGVEDYDLRYHDDD